MIEKIIMYYLPPTRQLNNEQVLSSLWKERYQAHQQGQIYSYRDASNLQQDETLPGLPEYITIQNISKPSIYIYRNNKFSACLVTLTFLFFRKTNEKQKHYSIDPKQTLLVITTNSMNISTTKIIAWFKNSGIKSLQQKHRSTSTKSYSVLITRLHPR